jgi:hypothetical protein
MNQRPVARGLLVCEKIVVEDRTRNVTLVNIFTTRRVRVVPSPPRPFAVFSSLADGLGNIALDLTVTRLDTDEEIDRWSQVVRFTDPLQEVRYLYRIEEFSYPVLGTFQFALLADGEPIAQTRIHVLV